MLIIPTIKSYKGDNLNNLPLEQPNLSFLEDYWIIIKGKYLTDLEKILNVFLSRFKVEYIPNQNNKTDKSIRFYQQLKKKNLHDTEVSNSKISSESSIGTRESIYNSKLALSNLLECIVKTTYQ